MNHEVKKKAVQQLLSLFSHLGPNKNIKNIVNEWMNDKKKCNFYAKFLV